MKRISRFHSITKLSCFQEKLQDVHAKRCLICVCVYVRPKATYIGSHIRQSLGRIAAESYSYSRPVGFSRAFD